MHYFLKEENNVNEDTKGEDHVKKENCLNLGNSGQTNLHCEMEDNELTNHYDEETVLLQIPQEDAKIGSDLFVRTAEKGK